jgi:hypothetical protein
VTRPLPGDMGMHRVTDVMPRVAMVAAGAAHTSCITDRGVVLAWRSADPQATAREVGGLLTGKQAVHISAGKFCNLEQPWCLDFHVVLYGWRGGSYASCMLSTPHEELQHNESVSVAVQLHLIA